MAKNKWLNEQQNGGKASTTWEGGPAHTIKGGDLVAKQTLLVNLKKQMGLSPSHSFVAPKAAK